MPSLLPGYEYDIFISYRQKDNRGDRWVTEFVHSLKTELEATFKEDITQMVLMILSVEHRSTYFRIVIAFFSVSKYRRKSNVLISSDAVFRFG